MPTSNELSLSQLREAIQLREKIDSLHQQLGSILGGETSGGRGKTASAKRGGPKAGAARTGVRGKQSGMSAATREKIAAAQRARWAKTQKDGGKKVPSKTAASKAQKKGSGMTGSARAKIGAAMRARWAARKTGSSSSATAKA